jgi:DNA-binding beta-propeller fold protein YncE
MFSVFANSIGRRIRFAVTLILLLMCVTPLASAGDKKKKDTTPVPAEKNWYEKLDLSKFVWPDPPSITRMRYLDYLCCQKEEKPSTAKKKSTWMDRMAGGESQQEKSATHPRFGLWSPNGVAVDSKGRVYVADSRVGAIFIFNTESKDLDMIKHGRDANFGVIIGLAMDDNDRLFVSDAKLSHVLVFDANHKLEATIRGGMVEPSGLAIDVDNRLLYVVDTEQDIVLVFDADNYNLIRKIGVPGKKHTLTGPGEFAKPTGAAVDAEGNVFVTDLLNNRVEVFDADGGFIREFGKHGDGPGNFSRPKGIAVNSDGFVWVADAMLDRLQLFTPEGQLLMWVGTHGGLPGQFNVLAGVAVDKQNRVFTTEQYHARVQIFRYTTQAEAHEEFLKRTAEADKKSGTRKPASEAPTPEPKPEPQNTTEKPKSPGAQ